MPISPEQRRGLDEQLRLGVDALGLALSAQQIEQLLDYVQLLEKWNRTYNLTAVREPEQMVTRHVLDSLAILPYLDVDNLIDVGTGGGLPGVVIAIARPNCQVDLLDSNGKKTRFLTQVKTALGLANITVHHCRVQDLRKPAAYQAVVSRAFASLTDMVSSSAYLQAPDGVLLAMKGQRPDDELTALPASVTVGGCYAIDVPGLHEARHLVVLTVADQVDHC